MTVIDWITASQHLRYKNFHMFMHFPQSQEFPSAAILFRVVAVNILPHLFLYSIFEPFGFREVDFIVQVCWRFYRCQFERHFDFCRLRRLTQILTRELRLCRSLAHPSLQKQSKFLDVQRTVVFGSFQIDPLELLETSRTSVSNPSRTG